MELLLSMFRYPFIVRAFVVGILVSLCASLLGVSLVLKRYSMIGDGLSHVSFGALAENTAMSASALTRLRSATRSSTNAAATTTGMENHSGENPHATATASAPNDTWDSPSPIFE